MNNMIWDAVLWLRKKLSKDKEDIIEAVNNIQNLFETSADATASSSDILAGKTAYNGTVLLTGTMKDRRGITVTAGATTQDDEYTYLSIPEEACYNANSKVRTPNSNIANVKKYTYPIKYLAAGASVEMIYPKSAIAVYIGAQEGFSAGCACLILCDGTKCGYAIEATVISETVVKFTNPSGTYGKAHNFEYGYFYI